ncbi:tetratricopeptide repeat protein [Dulcicalothrix desertica]|nr:tetratricopeptide repeat protein [Dulcicalothrix desertica]TWH39137.1 Tfp pilus assembly protein PilF [Dulcicalothrix desertica PCC 7102]
MENFFKRIIFLGCSLVLTVLILFVTAAPAMAQHSHDSSISPTDSQKSISTEQFHAAESFFNQALEQLDIGNLDAALEYLNKTISLNPYHEYVYLNRGELHHKLKQYPQAIADYTLAIQSNPNFSYIYVQRGKVRDALGDYQDAIADYSKAIQLYPEDGIGYSNRGAVYYKLGQIASAISDFNQAIRFNSGRADAYFRRADFRQKIGNYQGAVLDYQVASQLYSEQGKMAESENMIKLLQKYSSS